MFVERKIMRVPPGKWTELWALDKKLDPVEKRLGFPAKRYLRCWTGTYDANTLIIERQWSNLNAMEAILTKAAGDPEWQAVSAAFQALLQSTQLELYLVHDVVQEGIYFVAAWNN